MKFLFKIIDFIFSNDFQVSFWSNIVSSSVVGLFVYQYTDVFKSPDLRLVVKQNGSYRDTILLIKDNDKYKAKVQFAIKNNGNKVIKANEGYWHCYINTTSHTIFSVSDEENHSRGVIDGSVYPGSFFDLGLIYNLEIKKEDVEKGEIPYFFSTNYGQYPKTAKIDSKTGLVQYKNMGYIKYQLPE